MSLIRSYERALMEQDHDRADQHLAELKELAKRPTPRTMSY